MATTFYSDLFQAPGRGLDAILNTYVHDVSNAFMLPLQDTVKILLGIYIALWGWAMMRGTIQEPVLDGFTRIIRLTVIVAIAINITQYERFIAHYLFDLPNIMSTFIVNAANPGGPPPSSNLSYLDEAMAKFDAISTAMIDLSLSQKNVIGIPNMTAYLTGWLVYIGGALLTAYCAFLLALSKIALSVLLGIGPIFVLCLIFEPMKRFFETWLGQALNFVMLVILTSATLSIILKIIMGFLGTGGPGGTLVTTPQVSLALTTVIFCGIGLLIMIQVPAIASALGGGVAISTLGAAAAVMGKMARFSKSAAGGAWNLASGKTLHGAKQRLRMAKRQYAPLARGAKAIYNRVTGGKNRIASP